MKSILLYCIRGSNNMRQHHIIMILGIIWSIPVLGMLGSLSNDYVSMLTYIAGISTFILIIIRIQYSVYAIPFIVLLAPMGGYISILNIKLLLSDIVFILFFVQYFYLIQSKKIKFRYSAKIKYTTFLIFICFVSVSYGLVVRNLISPMPYILLLQIIIVYSLTRYYVDQGWKASYIFDSWTLATLLASIVLIISYYNGVDLQLFDKSNTRMLAGRESNSIATYFIRGRYYYVPFHFVLGVAILTIFNFYHNRPYGVKLLYIISIIIFLISMIILQNKTLIVALIASLIIYHLFITTRKYYSREKRYFISIFTFILTIAPIVVLYRFVNSMFSNQVQLWYIRLSGISSLKERLFNYSEALSQWLDYPIALIIGMGPDFLNSSGNPDITGGFKKSGEKLTVGTVDSGWVSFFIEIGFLGGVILIIIFMNQIIKFIRLKINQPGDININQLINISTIFFAISLLTQMIGYTKLVWLPVQVMAISAALISNANCYKTQLYRSTR